ncbi:MAG: hypothetical protein LBK58_00755, partial [Prevotellaceae bacterium]|nr:hypothetical protein [Prevotellaceae bacterium]
MELLTGFGKITLRKSHPLAVSPSGFGISAYVQFQMCRPGSRLVFAEAEEELQTLCHIPCNAKQIERICHHYGGSMDSVDWHKICEKSQLKMPFKCESKQENPGSPLYAMMDGSMILTREKEQKYKELKLFRSFYAENRIEGISKQRNMIAG